MFNTLVELWKLNWNFFFRKSKHTVKCWQCRKDITITARPPRMDDYGPVGSNKCRCGAINVVSRHVHSSVGFSRDMPEATRLKRDSSSKIQ